MSSASVQLIEDISQFCADPLGFARYAFPWGEPGELSRIDGPRAFQCEVLGTIRDHLNGPDRYSPLQLSISSGHGIGKSALIAMIMNWAMSTCDDCRIVVTAGTGKQLATKTWPEVSKWFRMAINAHWWDIKAESIVSREKGHERLWRADAVTWSENNTEAFAGLHNYGRRIVVIYDESSSIADKVWEVTEGALTDEDTEIIWVAFGNPTQNTGRFRECFGKLKHRWKGKQIDSRTIPGTNKALFEKWIADYGEDSDFVRVRVRGEFPRAGSTQFIPSDVVQMCRDYTCPPEEIAQHGVLAVDVARFGDDQSVVGYRRGRKFEVLKKYRGLDTVQLSRHVAEWMRLLLPRETVVDGDGIGAGVVDNLRDMHEVYKRKRDPLAEVFKTVHEFHGGGSPIDGDMYYNKRAEVWGMARDWLKGDADIPDDPELADDLTGVQYGFANADGQIQLEKKEDMKKRGLSSPDNGDCLAMTFSVVPHAKTREELLAEAIDAEPDPVAKHFMRLRETERRKKADKPLNYWE